jgi:hypothetical protein
MKYFSTSKPMFMYGGGLSSMYKLAQVHMHWGSKSQLGNSKIEDLYSLLNTIQYNSLF